MAWRASVPDYNEEVFAIEASGDMTVRLWPEAFRQNR